MLVMLSGCGVGGVQPSATPAPTVSPAPTTPASSAPPAVPAEPIYVDGGTAEANRSYFDLVNRRLFDSNAEANGQMVIESLVAAGFQKAEMQLTPDRTVGNLKADSILFAVNMGGTCLLGQYGSGGYSSAAQKALEGGGCLIGKTRTIDF